MTRRLLAALFVTATAFALIAKADPVPNNKPPTVPKTGDNSGARPKDDLSDPRARIEDAPQTQDRLKRQFDEFKQSLLRLSQRLENSSRQEDKDKAAVLKDALTKVNELGTQAKFEGLISILKASDTFKDTDKLQDAIGRNDELRKDLNLLIEILSTDDKEALKKQKMAEIARMLEQLKETIAKEERIRARVDLGRQTGDVIKPDQDKANKAMDKMANPNPPKADYAKAEGKLPPSEGKDAPKSGENKNDTKDPKAEERPNGESKDTKPNDGGDPKETKPSDPKAGQETKPGENKDGKENKPGENKDGKGDKENKPSDPKDGKGGDKPEGKPSDPKDGKGGEKPEGKPSDPKDGKGGDKPDSKAGDDKPAESKESKPGDGKAGEPKDGKGGDPKDGKGGDKPESKPADSKGGESKDGKPGDGKAAESKPGDSKSGESKDGKPSDGKSGESKDGKPGEGKPGESKDGKPGEAKPGQSGKPGDPKNTDPKPGQAGKPGEAKPGSGKPGDPKPGEGKPGAGKPGDPKPGDAKPGSGKPPEGGKPGEGKPSESKAKGDGKAEGKPGEGKPGEGKPGAAKGSPSPAKPGQPEPPPPSEGKPPDNAPPPPGPGGKPPNAPPSDLDPARKKIQDAQKDGVKAASELEKNKLDKAGPEIDNAIDKMKDAQKKLEDLLKQLRQEEVERILAQLQARCEKMLAMEIAIRDGTTTLQKAVFAHADQKADRVDIQNSNGLADKQDLNVKEANLAIRIIEAEGSAVAFPEVFKQVREDMVTTKSRLDRTMADELTVQIEEDIIATLKEMIESLKKARKEAMPKPPPPPGAPKPPGKPPKQSLIDEIAELKMIRSMQEKVNKRTELYGKQYPDTGPGQLPDVKFIKDPKVKSNVEAIQQELQDLSKRQDKIHKITDDIAKGKNKNDD